MKKTRSVSVEESLPHKLPSRTSIGERRSPNANNSAVFAEGAIGSNDSVSPISALVNKLEQASEDLVMNAKSVDLRDFDMKMVSETAEDYNRRREEVRGLMADPAHFDENGRTDLKLVGAAMAGAKLLIDERRATRSICKILTNECGLEEEEFLYSGLKCGEREAKCARELSEWRQSSVLESLVDFHKQMKFKRTVLNYVASQQHHSKSDPRHTRQASMRGDGPRAALPKKPSKNSLLRTPPRHGASRMDPLDEKRVIESYALEVASEVAQHSKRRKIAGIPFNIHLLDDDDRFDDAN